MAGLQLHPRPLHTPTFGKNPLPQLLQTPSGLALLEMQGDINLPSHDDGDSIATESHSGVKTQETPIGRLIFPDYEPGTEGTEWMKRVFLYVGKHQLLRGEVKKLPKALAVVRRRRVEGESMDVDDEDEDEPVTKDGKEELEIVEIVKYKIIFSIRPEPVGTWVAGDGIAELGGIP